MQHGNHQVGMTSTSDPNAMKHIIASYTDDLVQFDLYILCILHVLSHASKDILCTPTVQHTGRLSGVKLYLIAIKTPQKSIKEHPKAYLKDQVGFLRSHTRLLGQCSRSFCGRCNLLLRHVEMLSIKLLVCIIYRK